MKILIDISEEDFEIIKHNVAVDNPLCPIGQKEMVTKIANGIPLPKGHGDLKDVSKLHYVTMLSQNPKTGKHKHITVVRAKEINDAPTIIEADKEVEE